MPCMTSPWPMRDPWMPPARENQRRRCQVSTNKCKRFIHCSVLKPPSLDLVVSYFFFRGALSVEAVCHPVLVSLVSSKHFCPFMTPFLLFYFAVSWQRRAQKQPVIMAASLRTAPLCIGPLFAFQFARKQVRVAAQKTAKHVVPLMSTFLCALSGDITRTLYFFVNSFCVAGGRKTTKLRRLN